MLVDGSAKGGTLNENEMDDLRELARSRGQDEQVLALRYRDRVAFDAITASLSKMPSYVQAGYSDQSSGAEVWIRFTDKPDDQTLLAIKDGLSYKVRIEYGTKLGWVQLNDMMERLFVLTRQQPGVLEVGASIDSKTDAIAITYTGDQRIMLNTQQLAPEVMLAASSEPKISGNIDQAFVTFTESSELSDAAATEVSVRGGGMMSTSTGPECTSGLPVVISGDRGITTAMHCTNSLRYGGTGATGIIAYRNAASTSGGANIDLQWHETLSPHSTSSTFYADTGSTDIRTISGATNAKVNDSVCNYGIGSVSRRCGYIQGLAACYTPEDLQFCGLAVVDRHITTGGDSGSPWFFGNNVKGVHSGRAFVDGASRSIYTPQTRIGENLSGAVLTS